MENDISRYLISGKQTKLNEKIQEITKSFTQKDFDLIFEILKWLRKNLKLDTTDKTELFRARTAQEIIESGFVTGCTDWALAFITLARAKEIPTKYVETIRRRWLDQGDENQIEGHIFAEVYINNKWYIIDPDEAVIRGWYSRHIIFAEGLDSWDIGIKNFEDLKTKFLEFKKDYLAGK